MEYLIGGIVTGVIYGIYLINGLYGEIRYLQQQMNEAQDILDGLKERFLPDDNHYY